MASSRLDWPQAWRVIASRYPPINLFERLATDPAVWDTLIVLEQLTNPRVRDEVGDIALVPPEERVSGPGASYVMAAFTHINPKGSRFSDGSFGVYYAAGALETAVAETVFHFEAFARDSADPPRSEEMRVLVGTVAAEFEEAGRLWPRWTMISGAAVRQRALARTWPLERRERVLQASQAPAPPSPAPRAGDEAQYVATLSAEEQHALLNPNSYVASQAYAKQIHAAGANGVTYPSVRHAGGQCFGAFRPRSVAIPHQERHLKYRWNGERVDRYFDYARDQWIGL